MKIVDCHGHIFPPLAEACGFDTAEVHRVFQQYAMHTHGNQPVRRARDNAIVADRHLWSPADPSEAGRAADVDFRVDGYGRFAWSVAGEDYYVQFLPPSLSNMEASAELMITQMDYAGIDALVLQNDHIYGNLADLFADAIRRFPGRFIGLAQVEEGLAGGDREIERLRAQVEEEGMRGLYFTLAGFFRSGWRTHYGEAAYRPFWDAVRSLSLPVFWVFPASSPWGSFLEEMHRFAAWLERYPDIPSVIVHGWPTASFAAEGDRIAWPAVVSHIQTTYPVYAEILYPIGWGGRREYPYAAAQDHIRQTYDRFGADRLIWGSDMPNVERYCTYRQSLTYVSEHCSYMSEAERAAVFGGNVLSLFGEHL